MTSRAELDNPNNFAVAQASSEAVSEANAYIGDKNTAGTSFGRLIDLRRLKEGQSGGEMLPYNEAVDQYPNLAGRLQGDGQINSMAAAQISKWKEEEDKYEAVLARSATGLLSGTVRNFAQQAWQTVKDPGELLIGGSIATISALAFPVAAGAGALATLATVAGEAVVENVISEAFIAGSTVAQFDEVSFKETATNVLVGSIFAGTLHGIGRGVKYIGARQSDTFLRSATAQGDAGRIINTDIKQKAMDADNVISETDKVFFRKHLGDDFLEEDMTLQGAFKKAKHTDDAITADQYTALTDDMDSSDMFDSRRFYLEEDNPVPVLSEEALADLDNYNANPDNHMVNNVDVREEINAGAEIGKDTEKLAIASDAEFTRVKAIHDENVKLAEESGKGLPDDEFSRDIREVVEEADYEESLVDSWESAAPCLKEAA